MNQGEHNLPLEIYVTCESLLIFCENLNSCATRNQKWGDHDCLRDVTA